MDASDGRDSAPARSQEMVMKLFAAFLFGGLMIAAAPAIAQDNKDMSKGAEMNHGDSMHHPMIRHSRRHHVSYTRNYKTDQDEEAQTRQLNMQYRGVSCSDIH
jgi:hypothetical protein